MNALMIYHALAKLCLIAALVRVMEWDLQWSM